MSEFTFKKQSNKKSNFKRYSITLFAILAIQTAFLFAVNNYFHVDDVTVAAPISPENNNQTQTEVEEDKGEARLVGISFDKKYYAIAYNKKLEVYPIKGEKPVFSVDILPGTYVSVMHWLPDEERFLYALANSSRAKSGRVEVHVVDVTNGNDSLVKELKKLSRGSHIKSFALSTYTNLLYVDIENRSKSDYIYQINIMKRMKRISLPSYKIGGIALASREELFFFEDTVRHQVFSHDGRRVEMVTPDDWNYCLLGITKDDKLYIGRLDGDQVTSIFLSDKDGHMELFADLSHEVSPENISQGLNGQLVLKDYPSANYVTVIKPEGNSRVFSKKNKDAFVTGDAIFYMQDDKMHITFLE